MLVLSVVRKNERQGESLMQMIHGDDDDNDDDCYLLVLVMNCEQR